MKKATTTFLQAIVIVAIVWFFHWMGPFLRALFFGGTSILTGLMCLAMFLWDYYQNRGRAMVRMVRDEDEEGSWWSRDAAMIVLPIVFGSAIIYFTVAD